MQPLLITSLVALLIALIKIRSLIYERFDLRNDVEYQKGLVECWHGRHRDLRIVYDIQVSALNKLQVDNALLVASLKKKHRRVPKL